MAEFIDTKALKLRREMALKRFFEQIKADGTWRKWLNASHELHIAKVCKTLGEAEEQGKAWDATCFRGPYWAVPYKEDFNQWVKLQLQEELAAQDTDVYGEPLRNSIVLPPGLGFDGLPIEVADFIKVKLSEVKRLTEKVATMESQLNARDRKIFELQTQLDSIFDAERARDEHYLFSIRSLKYDD